MRKETINTSIAIIVAVVVVSIFIIGWNPFSDTGDLGGSNIGNNNDNITVTDSGLAIQDVTQGTGNREVQVGDTITVHYEGRLVDGTKFDSSFDRGAPATFDLLPGALIDGWVQGIPGMKVGGKRNLTIPPELGYGAGGQGQIPPNATLIFEVTLLEIK